MSKYLCLRHTAGRIGGDPPGVGGSTWEEVGIVDASYRDPERIALSAAESGYPVEVGLWLFVDVETSHGTRYASFAEVTPTPRVDVEAVTVDPFAPPAAEDLSTTELAGRVLLLLAERAPVTLGRIADALAVDRHNLDNELDALKDQGMVEFDVAGYRLTAAGRTAAVTP